MMMRGLLPRGQLLMLEIGRQAMDWSITARLHDPSYARSVAPGAREVVSLANHYRCTLESAIID